MPEPRAYPFGLDADTLVDVTSTCWRAHDGQWFLKTAARVGLEDAMRLDEQAIASLARIEIRELERAAGIDSLDTGDGVADWYRLSANVFGGLARPDRALTAAHEDTVAVEQRGWGEAFSARFRYTVTREPLDGRPCRYVLRPAARAAGGAGS